MKVEVVKTAGFCFGVDNAVKKTKEQLKLNSKMYCLGELVHNKQVIQELTKNGVVFIDNIEDARKGETVIFRAHGEPPKTYDYAKKHGINVVDLTCPKVSLIHKNAERYSNTGWYVFLIGEKEHSETIGTKGYCKNFSIIENEKDIEKAIKEFNKGNMKKLLVLVQTTFSIEKFDEYVKIIKSKLLEDINLEIKQTICDATRIRQQETEELSKRVDLMIVIGGENSANTKKLYEISNKNCKSVTYVQTKEDINEDVLKYNKIGITAGASTPKEIIEEVLRRIEIDSSK